jgi:cell division protein FtsI/penicillin-binding protein 2
MRERAAMVDTLVVRSARAMAMAMGCVLLAAACVCPGQTGGSPVGASGWAAAVTRAAWLVPDARIAVLDVDSGKLLGAARLSEAARTLAAPGSTLKPLALYQLVAAGRWDPSRRIACTRKLRIAGRSLACSHPPADPMNAQQALAWSCNTYFAAVGAGLGPGELRRLLAPTGLLGQTGLARDEAVAEFSEPHGADESSLALLGVEGVRVTPLELAAAYRWLALELVAHPASPAARVVQAGLADSASFGIAAAANAGGVPVAGKTGTANLGAGTASHGWFAGLVPAEEPQVVVVVYLPAGHGANAAAMAADLIAHSPLGKGSR